MGPENHQRAQERALPHHKRWFESILPSTKSSMWNGLGRSAKRNWLGRKGRWCTENWHQRIPKLHFYFDHDATNVNSVVFKDSKSAQKGGPKTGPWTDRYYSLITYKDGQLLRSEKSMCQNATFYEQWRHLHIPSPKSNYFSYERRTKNEDTILFNLI